MKVQTFSVFFLTITFCLSSVRYCKQKSLLLCDMKLFIVIIKLCSELIYLPYLREFSAPLNLMCTQVLDL